MEWGWFLPVAKHANAWRQGRKLLDRDLRSGSVAAFRPMQESKVRVLLTRMLRSPEDWESHLELYVISRLDYCPFNVFSVLVFRES